MNPIDQQTAKTKFVAEHVPMSVSICSNVPGYTEPECFVSEGDPQALLNKMGDRLEEIGDRAYAFLEEQFHTVFENIIEAEKYNLIGRLKGYLKQLPVAGFNSGRYDINMVKPYFINRFVIPKTDASNDDPEYEASGNSSTADNFVDDVTIELEPEDDEEEECEKELDDPSKIKVVKKGNNFMCISTPRFKFLDISNYIAPGFSYSMYLDAYGVKEKKGFFPYEYIDSLEKLNETKLPPQEAFYSKLKGKGISDEDYAYCQEIWSKKSMKTMRDFLIWYNNKDVGPFIDALKEQTSFYATELK